MKKSTLTVAIGLFSVTAILAQQTIREQNFDLLDPSQSLNNDSIAAGERLTNLGSADLLSSSWHFETFYFGPESKMGPAANESGDNIGVNNSIASGPKLSSSDLSVSGGDYNFKFNDADDILRLTFEEVDLSESKSIKWNLRFWINETTYENADHITFLISDGSTEIILRNLTSDSLSLLPQDNWNLFTNVIDDHLRISEFNSAKVQFIIEVSNNANDENIFIDDVQLIEQIVLGDPKESLIDDLSIYPNPCTNYLFVAQGVNWDKLTILDATGHTVSEFQFGDVLTLKHLQPGSYVYKLFNNKEMIAQEHFMKQ